MEIPANQEIIRNRDGTFPKGVSGNPAGRPVGQTMKEYVAQKFRTMSEQDKEKWLQGHYIEELDKWKMAEGNPSTHTDLTSLGGPLFSDEHKKKADEALRALTSDTQ